MQLSTSACLCAVLLLQLQGPVADASYLWNNFVPHGCFPKPTPRWVTNMTIDNSKAKLEKQKSGSNDLETMVDDHIKGGIHIVPGDIIRGETSNTGAEIGGVLSGPAGAVVGGPTTDMMITNNDTASTAANGNKKEIKPYGKVEYLMNIGKRSVSDHVIDSMESVALEVAGSRESNGDKTTKPQYETLRESVKNKARRELVDYLERMQAENVKEMNYIQRATTQQLVDLYEREKSNGANYD